MGQSYERILLVRTDRIGDWILSTPTLETLRGAFPQAQLSVLVNPSVSSLVETCPYLTGRFTYHEDLSAEERTQLVEKLKAQKFDAAVVLHIAKGLLSVLKDADIPIRVGPNSKLQSFFQLTHGVNQNRSQSTKSEAMYNLELLEPLGVSPSQFLLNTRVWLTDQDRRDADEYLKQNMLEPDTSYIVIHPGCGGSSLNWPLSRYRKLILSLIKLRDVPTICVSAGPGEEPIAQGLIIDQAGPLRRFFNIPNLRVFGELLRRAKLVIAGSTGPLHLARAVEAPVLAFYSPMLTQNARRWGPFPHHRVQTVARLDPTDVATVFVPDVECPVTRDCLGSHCSYAVEGRDCMGRILVDDVVQQIGHSLGLSRPATPGVKTNFVNL